MKQRVLSLVLVLILFCTVIPSPLIAAGDKRYTGAFDLLNYLPPPDLATGYPVPQFVINKSVSDVEKEMSGADYKNLYEKTMEIIDGKTNDYQRAEAIAGWISRNIHYDYGFTRPTSEYRDAYSVYKSKLSVCEGYSSLTQMMLYFADIPSVKISGIANQTYALRSLRDSGHAWNAAFLDGRWVFIDTTWEKFDFPYDFHESISEIAYFNGLSEFDLSILDMSSLEASDNEISQQYLAHHQSGEILSSCLMTTGALELNFHTEYDYTFDLHTNGYNGRDLIIPDNVKLYYKFIGTYFSGSEYLEKVRLPNTLSLVENGLFLDYAKLRLIEIPGSVTKIGAYSFRGCESLASISIPESVTEIGPSAFYGCSSLKQIDIPDGVKEISNSTFDSCIALTWVGLPASVRGIGSRAFAECYSLNAITIPPSVVSIEKDAFIYCLNLSIYGQTGSYAEQYAIENGIPFVDASNPNQPISVIFNGTSLLFDVPPQIINDRTMVPLRAIFEEMGASVDYNNDTKTVTATKDGTVVKLTIGDTSPTVNGAVVALDQPGLIVDGRTLAPLRFVAEAFGGTVEWDGATRTATISK